MVLTYQSLEKLCCCLVQGAEYAGGSIGQGVWQSVQAGNMIRDGVLEDGEETCQRREGGAG